MSDYISTIDVSPAETAAQVVTRHAAWNSLAETPATAANYIYGLTVLEQAAFMQVIGRAAGVLQIAAVSDASEKARLTRLLAAS
jgi:hypothetical protein